MTAFVDREFKTALFSGNFLIFRYDSVPMKLLVALLFLIPATSFASLSFDVSKARCHSLTLPANLQSEKYHWYQPSKTMKAVALMVHGLNNKPEIMLPLVKVLNEQGVGVLNVGLTGYVDSFSVLQRVTAQEWLQDVFIGNCLLQTKAQGLSQYYVGYSLGALIGEILMVDDLSEKFEFQKSLLFSPALEVHDRSHWIRIFSFLGRSLSVISFAPTRYVAHRVTPNAAYESLFDLIDLFNEKLHRNPQKINTPTQVFVDPDDELVSNEYLDDMVAVNGLDQWQMNIVHKDQSAQTWFHHVTIDEHAVGAKTWADMLSRIQDFFF
jgi:esterase/lipase